MRRTREILPHPVNACTAVNCLTGVVQAPNQAFTLASWRSGDAADCKSVYTGSIPVLASKITQQNQVLIVSLPSGALTENSIDTVFAFHSASDTVRDVSVWGRVAIQPAERVASSLWTALACLSTSSSVLSSHSQTTSTRQPSARRASSFSVSRRTLPSSFGRQ